MYHHSTFQVHDDRQVDVPLGHGNLVNGDLPQVFQFRPVEPLLQVGLLDFLDHIPTDAQMVRHVLNGHILRKFQGITLKGFSVGDARISKSNLHLPDDTATMTLHRGPPGPSRSVCSQWEPCENDGRFVLAQSRLRTHRPNTVPFPRLLDRKNHLTPHIRRLHVPIASNPK